METITKKIREKIYNELIDNHYISLDPTNNMTFLVLMFDYYNSLSNRQRVGDINSWDMQFINMLESSSFEDIFKFFKFSPYFIGQALKDNYNFNNLTTIEKQNLMYDLHFNSEKNNMTNNYLYISDMLSYMPFDNLSDLENSFHECIKIQNFEFNNYIDELLFNLDSLKEINYDKYKEIKLEIIHSFYKLDKYRLKGSKNIEIKNHIYHFLIEHLSNDNILKFSEKNFNFEYEVLKSHFFSKEIFPKVIYEQIITESEKDMSKKLIKKFNNNKKEN